MTSLMTSEMYDTASDLVKRSLELKAWTYCFQVNKYHYGSLKNQCQAPAMVSLLTLFLFHVFSLLVGHL